MTRLLRLPRQRLALCLGMASVLVLSLAPPAAALAAGGEVAALIEVEADAACTVPAAPPVAAKAFSNKTSKRTVSRQYAGTVTDPGDAADITNVGASITTSAKTTAQNRSLKSMEITAAGMVRMKSAQGSASDCDTYVSGQAHVNGGFKLKRRGKLTLRWDRKPNGFVFPLYVFGPGGELNAFALELETGGRSKGTITRKVPAGSYQIHLQWLMFLRADQAQPGVLRKRTSEMSMSLTYSRR